MKKAIIYIPTKSAMQSGFKNQDKWILEFETKDTQTSPLMGWESSDDTLSEVKLEFTSKEKAINYAKDNNIEYSVIEPNKKNFVIKSYSDNFTKD